MRTLSHTIRPLPSTAVFPPLTPPTPTNPLSSPPIQNFPLSLGPNLSFACRLPNSHFFNLGLLSSCSASISSTAPSSASSFFSMAPELPPCPALAGEPPPPLRTPAVDTEEMRAPPGGDAGEKGAAEQPSAHERREENWGWEVGGVGGRVGARVGGKGEFGRGGGGRVR